MKQDKYPKTLLTIFLIFWLILAISPSNREIWFTENILTFLFIPLLIYTYKKFRLTNLSYTFIFIFMILHTIGSHYSYAEVPLFNKVQDSFNLSRNHYDRIVHFLFGFIFFAPIYEVLTRKLKLSKSYSLLFAFLLVTSLKGIYEVLEYLYYVFRESKVFSDAFLGSQGDIWDAQKDMLLGIIGSLIALVIIKLNCKEK